MLLLALSAAPGLAGDGRVNGPSTASLSGGVWRRAENDGLNCLFLQLRTLGYRGRYETYLETMGRHRGLDRMSGLADAAADLGFGLLPARLTLAELENLHAPVTAYLEPEARGAGSFWLVVGFDDADEQPNVILVDGGTATAEVVSRDVFRREWSGYALVAPLETGWAPLIRRGLAAALVASAVVVAGNRIWKSQ